MPDGLDKLDVKWAWAPYAPTRREPWTRRLAAHLCRRAGFGATSAELDEAVKSGPQRVIDPLCDGPKPSRDTEAFERSMASLASHAVASGNPNQLSAAWLYRMHGTPDPLLEKLTLFWHGHFATSAAKVTNAKLMLAQHELLRLHSRGKFGEMVKAVSRDPAMLIYLDSTTNRRIRPNENYARELMELFCLGVGNYTEADIKEVARAFTGWEVLGERFHYNKVQHDTGNKSFLGASGDFDGDGAVDVVLAQPAAARFVARKLIRFFVFDEPNPAPDALVEPIAQELRDHDFTIGPVVRKILGSNLFYSEHSIGRKIRSPVELGVGLLRTLGASTNMIRLADGLRDLGQALFFPPNVKGWDGGRAWINSSTLLGRANLVRRVLTAGETKYKHGTLAATAERAGAKSGLEQVDWLLELLVAVPIPADARAALVKLAGADDLGAVVHAISALPEFQLS